MKKYIALIIALICALNLVGCSSRSINDIIKNEPSIRGIVTEVQSDYVIIYANEDGYPNNSRWQISLNPENKDSDTDLVIGDEIVVYYDGNVMETDPLKVDNVYAIILETPAMTSDLYEFIGYEDAMPHSTKPVEQPVEQPAEPVEPPVSEPADEDLVRVLDYIPSIYVELKYATEDNFTGKVIYDFSDASLRYGTVKKLMEVQNELNNQGYSLKIWDAYRPISAQFTLWETCPDPVYVANPNSGYSSHSKGNTIDVTLVRSDGTEITMPTGFDDFSALADRNYSDVSNDAAVNARLLENTMSTHGFNCYSSEWWHFSDTTAYSVIRN